MRRVLIPMLTAIAVACGNTFICKPSEQVPFTQKLVWELVHEAGFPPGGEPGGILGHLAHRGCKSLGLLTIDRMSAVRLSRM